MKNMPDGTCIIIQPRDDIQSVNGLKNILKRRADSDNIQLKTIYDEGCRR